MTGEHLRHPIKSTQQSILDFWLFVVVSARLQWVSFVLLVLFGFLFLLTGEFELPQFLDEENPLGQCAWGFQEAFIRYVIPFTWNGNRALSTTKTPLRSPWLFALYESYS